MTAIGHGRSLLVQRTWSVMTNDVLISVPLFVFMGYIVERANILDRLFRSIQLAVGRLARLARHRHARHLRAVRHRHRHRRRGRDADGPAGLPGHAARTAMTSSSRPAWSAPAAASAFSSRRASCSSSMARPPASRRCSSMPGAFFPGLMLAGLYMVYVMIRAADQSGAGAADAARKSATCPIATIAL